MSIYKKVVTQGQRAKNIAKFSLGPIKSLYKNKGFRDASMYRYFLDTVKLDDKMVLFECAHGSKIGGNPYALYVEMDKNPTYRDYRFIWVLNESNPQAEELAKRSNVKIVKRDSPSYLKYLCKAKYLINDTTFPFYFSKKEGQVYVNTWHGTPIKTLGKDVAGSIGQQKNAVRNYMHADYILHPNRFTADIIASSHDLNGIFKGKMVDTGYPRIDLTMHANKDRVKKQFETWMGLPIDKKVVLYAPTWRGEIGKINNIEAEICAHIEALEKDMPDDYLFLLKVHNLTYRYIKDNRSLEKICVPNWVETNELLAITDVLITDYSSIFFDFLYSGKPVLFFVYDQEQYEKERGLYMDLKDMPGPLCQTVDEVIASLRDIEGVQSTYQNAYQSFYDTYCYNDDGNASKRTLDIVFGNKTSQDVYSIYDDKKQKILLYGGGFTTNGVTNSLLNLLENIDYTAYDVTLLHGGSINQEVQQNLEKVNPHVRLLFRCGASNFRFMEYYKHRYIMNSGLKRAFIQQHIPESLYQNELKRITGDADFDIAIDFCGYVPFWSLLFSFSGIEKKCIYLHSDMVADSNRMVNDKFPLKKNLEIIFKLYRHYDKLICVSKDVTTINYEKLKPYGVLRKLVNVDNALNYQKVLDHAVIDPSDTFTKDGVTYFVNTIASRTETSTYTVFPLPQKEQIPFVVVGRLSPEKGHVKLIHAFKKVVQKHPQARLYIVGGGVLEETLTELITSLSLEEHVILTGSMDNPFQILQVCDCFVLSSDYEGQGLVVLESLVLNKPVLSTDIPGPRGILENGYGELVDNSVDGLASGMLSFIEQPKTYPSFDYHAYNQVAMDAFYREIKK